MVMMTGWESRRDTSAVMRDSVVRSRQGGRRRRSRRSATKGRRRQRGVTIQMSVQMTAETQVEVRMGAAWWGEKEEIESGRGKSIKGQNMGVGGNLD